MYQEALRGLLAAQGRGAAHCPPPARGARGGAAPPRQGRGHGAEAGARGQEVDREVEAAVEGDQQVGDLDDVGDELTQQTLTRAWIMTTPHLGVPVQDLTEGGDQLGRVAHEVEQHDGHGHPGQPHLPPPQRVVARPGQHTMSGDWRLKYL